MSTLSTPKAPASHPPTIEDGDAQSAKNALLNERFAKAKRGERHFKEILDLANADLAKGKEDLELARGNLRQLDERELGVRGNVAAATTALADAEQAALAAETALTQSKSELEAVESRVGIRAIDLYDPDAAARKMRDKAARLRQQIDQLQSETNELEEKAASIELEASRSRSPASEEVEYAALRVRRHEEELVGARARIDAAKAAMLSAERASEGALTDVNSQRESFSALNARVIELERMFKSAQADYQHARREFVEIRNQCPWMS